MQQEGHIVEFMQSRIDITRNSSLPFSNYNLDMICQVMKDWPLPNPHNELICKESFDSCWSVLPGQRMSPNEF